MSNFTVAIPDDLLSDAKIVAAQTGTSVNSIIRQLLEGHVRSQRSAMPGNYEILFKYSLGQVTSRTAVRELHLDSDEALHAMVVNAGLPLPRLSQQETEQMQKRLHEMVEQHGQNAA